MSNNLLHKEIRKNPIPLIGRNDLLIDELFGIVRLHITDNGLICVTIYNQLNYSKAKEFTSHHESHGTFFYHNHKTLYKFDTKMFLHQVKHLLQ